MTDKQLRKLKRVELLELLVDQAAEMEALQQKLEAAEKALEDRRVLVEEAGTMAGAILRINRVMEAAEQAAKDYLESARAQAAAIIAEAEAKAAHSHKEAD